MLFRSAEFSVAGYLEDNGMKSGYTLSVVCPKNKTGAQFGQALVPLLYESGVDYARDIFTLGVLQGVIVKSGSWYKYTPEDGEEMRWQGADNAVAALNENPSYLLPILEGVEIAVGIENLGGALVNEHIGGSLNVQRERPSAKEDTSS